MTVRTAKKGDFAKVIEIEELSFPTAWDYDFLEALISNCMGLRLLGKDFKGYISCL
jgi:hypothetical protein